MNLVVWGLGKHAINKILPAVDNSDKFILYGVCTRNNKKLAQVQDLYNVKAWNSSIEMFKDKNIDAIYLATPPALHKEQAVDILDNGLHLLCEKPITLFYKDTAYLIEKAIKSKLVLFEALMYKYHPQYQQLKSILDEKKLGKINSIKSSFQLPPLEHPGYRTTKTLGASAIYDLGIYPASLIIDLFGYSHIELSSKNIEYDKSKNYDVAGEAILKIHDDIECLIDWAYNKTYVNEVSIDCEYLRLESKFIFSKDYAHKAIISLYSGNELIENIEVDEADHFALMLESFFDSINDPQKTYLRSDPMLDLSIFLDNLAK